MKFIVRFLYSLVILAYIYILQPILICIFAFIYLCWNLEWITKDCLETITEDFHVVKTVKITDLTDLEYKNVWYYLIDKPKPSIAE